MLTMHSGHGGRRQQILHLMEGKAEGDQGVSEVRVSMTAHLFERGMFRPVLLLKVI